MIPQYTLTSGHVTEQCSYTGRLGAQVASAWLRVVSDGSGLGGGAEPVAAGRPGLR